MPKRPATMEEIAQQKQDVLQQLRAQKQLMQDTARDLFAPTKAATKMEMVMNSINSGIAMYDGVMTGIRLMRRVRKFFKKT